PEHQPRLVAIPEGCDRIHHDVAVFLLVRKREEDADAEIEAVEDNVHGNGGADQTGPDEREIFFHRPHSFDVPSENPGPLPRERPVASRAASSAAESGRFGRPSDGSVASPFGPAWIRRLM